MKKIALLISAFALIGVFGGCLVAKQVITFTTPAYSYLVPSVDTIDFTTAYETNAYVSKIVCADEEALNAGGPALMSSYAKPETGAVSTVFNLTLERLEKYDGQLCDLYVTAYDAATIEETEAVLRVHIGEIPDTPVETGTICEDGTVCSDSEAASDGTSADTVIDTTADETTEPTVDDGSDNTITE